MLLHKEKKAIVLFNMKTGSMSLRRFLERIDSGFDGGNWLGMGRTHSNPFLWMLPKYFPDFDVDNELMNYHVSCFYRDPIDRFLSGMFYAFRRQPEVDSTIRVKKYYEEQGYWGYQYRWLGTLFPHDSWDATPWHPVPIHYYNFHDYDNEVVRLCSDIGITITKDQIPHENSSDGNRLYLKDLTQDEIEFLKELYLPDYLFLASRGLQVESA